MRRNGMSSGERMDGKRQRAFPDRVPQRKTAHYYCKDCFQLVLDVIRRLGCGRQKGRQLATAEKKAAGVE
jgi:hypothetical protein